MNTPTLQFVRRGRIVSLPAVPATRTLLELLREDLASTGTKEGCNEGDCGACTVVLGERVGDHLEYKAVNSCIRLAHSIQGMALWTAEDLSDADGALHPVQQALVQQHGSQCGFCTPGIVMSLFCLYQNQVRHGQPVTRAQAQEALSGNLCRCTGYRSILDAAQTMDQYPRPHEDEPRVLELLRAITPDRPAPGLAYQAPDSLAQLLAARAQYPDAQLVAGGTDLVLWINKLHRPIAQLLDVTRVPELRQIIDHPDHVLIGAAVPLTYAFAALAAQYPQLSCFASRFAGLPVRNAGTLGGNVANGSPIGDSMPLLLALNARVLLQSRQAQRELPLAQFYTGYRQNVMAPHEILAGIKVPKAGPTELLRVYKISKRFEDDISAVCLAIRLQLVEARVVDLCIGVGGVAATPVRAYQTEAALRAQAWTENSVRQAMAVLRAEFAPISDLRASGDYRVQVLGNLLLRFWLESQGDRPLNLESFTLDGVPS